ncbi:aspartate aminotransferase family protein [Corallococcus exiguus]|uniref:pyridoxal phosphate-dependent decarboxylase family protein n=1 Tax=Corallococcus exiguus TaxID=83462 RepID=UPI001A8CBA98|nr:aminotransferase class V-fold PLP-dependent enzyme [Corallococcus exiguus]MBN8471457.1 aspartate aminotransferase family protein [Corallococcus exiguus]
MSATRVTPAAMVHDDVTEPSYPELPPALRAAFEALPEDEVRARMEGFVALTLQRLRAPAGSPVPPPVPSRLIARAFEAPLPEQGQPIEAILADVAEHVMPHGRDKRSPTWFAQLDVPPTDYSVFSGLLIRALAQDPITFSSARSGTFVERQVLGWLRSLAFPDVPQAGGCFTSGGTQSNFQALLILRNEALRRAGADVNALGLVEALSRTGHRGMRVFASEASHPSIFAAVRQLGLGDAGLHRVPTDGQDRLCPIALEAALVEARRQGQLPAVVVLTAGSSGVGAVDPLREGMRLAHQHGALVHVDAAHGSLLLFSQRHRGLLDGLQGADTVTLDPHKVLGLNAQLGGLLVRDARLLTLLGKVSLDYFVTSEVADLGEVTLDGSRALNSLGAWLLLRHFGRDGYGQLVDHLFALARDFTRRLKKSGCFELFPDTPTMNMLAFRLRPKAASETPEELARENARNDALLSRLMQSRKFAVSCYRHASGRLYLRAVFINPASRPEHMAALADALIQLAREAE